MHVQWDVREALYLDHTVPSCPHELHTSVNVFCVLEVSIRFNESGFVFGSDRFDTLCTAFTGCDGLNLTKKLALPQAFIMYNIDTTV